MSQAWEYNGVDLTRHGYNVTLLGGPLNIPGRRGENIVIPSKSGRWYVPKWPDQRRVTLTMFVRNIPAGGGSASEANMLANLDVLRGLFALPGQHTFKHLFGSTTRVAQAEVVTMVDFIPEGILNVYRFQVEFLLADPFWYAESATTVGPVNITMPSQNITVTNPGTYRAEKAIFTLTGGTNPRLTIGSTYVEYIGVVSGTLTLDCGTFTATLNGVDVSGNVAHAGEVQWLPIPPGANTLNVASPSYGGALTVSFTPPYL